MKNALPSMAAMLAVPLLGANSDLPEFDDGLLDADRAPALDYPALVDQLQTLGSCTDTIELVRQERGLPPLDRRAADPDGPILFKAVDYDIDGCDVLLVGDGDVRSLPLPTEGPLRPIPAQ